MASFFQQLSDVVQIDEENSITIVAPTYGQVQDANSKAIKTGFDMDTQKGALDFDGALMEKLLFQACIKSWSGPGFEGRPVTPENIDALPAFVIEAIRPSVNKFTKSMQKTEKKS